MSLVAGIYISVATHLVACRCPHDNPTWKALQWDDIGIGVSQPYRLSPVPGIVGTSGGGIAGEIFNVTVDPSIPEKNKNGAAK